MLTKVCFLHVKRYFNRMGGDSRRPKLTIFGHSFVDQQVRLHKIELRADEVKADMME